MRALVKERIGPGLSLLEVDIPQATELDDVQIRVEFCAICSSDTRLYSWNEWASGQSLALPMMLGHEVSGTVTQVGSGVRDIVLGDRVVVDPFIHCGLCYQCRTGHTNLCINREIYGKHRGGFAEYSVIPDRAICKLPAGLTLQEGALLENLGIAVHATEFKVHHPGDYAVVIGAGPIGLLACQVLETYGVQVVVTDIRQSRLELATTLTAATSVNIENMDLVEAVMDLTEGRGADFVLEAAATQSALDHAFEIVRPGGTVVTIGTFDKGVILNPFFQMTRREIRFIGSLGRNWSSWNKMLNLLGAHEIDLSSMITHVLPMEDFEQGFDLAASYDAMKVLLKP